MKPGFQLVRDLRDQSQCGASLGDACLQRLITCVVFQIVTSASTDLQDYTYYFVPAPWLSVKLLRLLQCYPPPGNSHAARTPGRGLISASWGRFCLSFVTIQSPHWRLFLFCGSFWDAARYLGFPRAASGELTILLRFRIPSAFT